MQDLDTSKFAGLLKVDPETLESALSQAGFRLVPIDGGMSSTEPETTDDGESMPTDPMIPGQADAPAPADAQTDMDVSGEAGGEDMFGGMGRTAGGVAHKLLKRRSK